MKFTTRRAAAIVLAIALSLPSAALASSREDRGRERDIPQRIIQIIKKLQQRLFGGVTVSDDLPLPPRP